MRQALTLLQRGVIQRLRTAGRHDLAELADAAWKTGKQTALFGDLKSAELRDDFDRANAQAISSAE